ncbi:MAG: hypothetical protein ACKO5K_02240 [Armatimonadota bacterium]
MRSLDPPDPWALERLPFLAGYVRATPEPIPAALSAQGDVRSARWFRGACELRARVVAGRDPEALRRFIDASRAVSSLAPPWSPPGKIVPAHPVRPEPVPPAGRAKRIRETRAYLARRGIHLAPAELAAVALPKTAPACARTAAGTVAIEVWGMVHTETIRRGRARASSDPGQARLDAMVRTAAQTLARAASPSMR